MRMSNLPRLFITLLILPLATPSLYSSKDQVVILNADNFHSTLEGKPHAWMVEFYASWCGYCQNLSPTFKELASEMASWRDIIQVAVIDCGDETNNQAICKEASIAGFPTIQYFPPNITRGEVGVNSPDVEHTKGEMKQNVIDFLEDLIESLREEQNPLSWPNLQPINVNSSNLSFTDLWPVGNEETFVVVERADSYIGKEVILSTWRRMGGLVVERMAVAQEVVNQKAALASLGVTSFPGVLVLNSEDQSVMAVDIGNGTVPEILRAIRNQAAKTALRNPANFRRASSTVTLGTTSTERARVEEARSEILRRRYSVFLSDLEKTVLFALKNEVAVQSEIDQGALRQFLDVLIRYFPQNSRLMPHLAELSAGLKNTSMTSSQVSTELLTKIVSLEDSEDWVGCKGSAPKFGGYPCGLWQLWHTLTLAQGEEEEDPRVVLRAMVAYVRHFFSCRECSEHFLSMVHNGTAIEEEVSSATEAVLFLWAAHNAVNLRLANDVSSDPVFPKLRFPSEDFCPACWDEDGQPEEQGLLAFLHSLYSADSILDRARIRETDFDYTSSASTLLFHSLSLVSLLLL